MRVPRKDLSSMDIAVGTKYLLDHIETTVGVNAAIECASGLVGCMLAAGVYYMGRLMAPESTTDVQILHELQGSCVEATVNRDGNTYSINNLNVNLTTQIILRLPSRKA